MRLRRGGALLIIATVGCGRFGFDSSTTDDADAAAETDGNNVVADSDAAALEPDAALDPLGLFNEPIELPELVGTAAADPSLTADQLEMFLVINGNISHVVRASTDDPFGGLRTITELNSGELEATPKLAPNGTTMFLASTRTGGLGGRDIWTSTRPVDRWNTPSNVGELNGPDFEGGPSTSFNTRRMVFVSNRDGGLDLFESVRADSALPWEAPLPITLLNSSAAESDPFLSADGLELYFCSTRAGGLGGADIYVTTRPTVDDSFVAPRPMTELNSVSDDCGVWLSPDRREVYFTSDRNGGDEIFRADR